MGTTPGANRNQPLPATDLENVIVFDAVCVLCSGFARFMARHDTRVGFRFVDARSETGRALYLHYRLDPDVMETNIVIFKGRAHTKMASFTCAMKSLGWPFKALAVLDLLPRRVADWLYDRIAFNRYPLRAAQLPAALLRAEGASP